MSRTPSILPPLLGRYHWIPECIHLSVKWLFPSWPNPDKLSVLQKKKKTSFITKRKEERMSNDRERKRERVLLTPFCTQQGKFSVLKRVLVNLKSIGELLKDRSELCWTWSRATNAPWFHWETIETELSPWERLESSHLLILASDTFLSSFLPEAHHMQSKSHHWGFALFLLAILFWVYLAKICVAFEITLPICMQIVDCCRTPTAEIRFQSFLCCCCTLSGVLRCRFAIMNVTESCFTDNNSSHPNSNHVRGREMEAGIQRK